MKLCRSECGEMCLVIPAALARRRTIRVAAVAVHTVAGLGQQQRPRCSLAGGQVDGPCDAGRERDHGQLGALAEHGDDAMAALERRGPRC